MSRVFVETLLTLVETLSRCFHTTLRLVLYDVISWSRVIPKRCTNNGHGAATHVSFWSAVTPYAFGSYTRTLSVVFNASVRVSRLRWCSTCECDYITRVKTECVQIPNHFGSSSGLEISRSKRNTIRNTFDVYQIVLRQKLDSHRCRGH